MDTPLLQVKLLHYVFFINIFVIFRLHSVRKSQNLLCKQWAEIYWQLNVVLKFLQYSYYTCSTLLFVPIRYLQPGMFDQ